MREKGRSIAVLGLLLASMAVKAQGYTDLPPNHWAREAVEALTQQGVLTGFPDGTFRGGDPATRYQMALALYRLYVLLDARLRDLRGAVASGDTARALEAAKGASQAAELLQGALPPQAEKVAEELLAIRARIGTLEEALARAMGEIKDQKAFQEALVALEGAQNADLLEVRAQLETLRTLLKDLVTRQEYLEASQKLADRVARLAREVASLKEAMEKADQRLGELEAFANPRKEDLSLKGVEAQGHWATAPLPGEATEPVPGFRFGLTARYREATVAAGGGYGAGMPYATFAWKEGEGALEGLAGPAAGTIAYTTPDLTLKAWRAGEAQGASLEARAAGLSFGLRGQSLSSTPTPEDLYRLIGQPLPQTTALEADLSLGTKGQLEGHGSYLLTPSSQWARLGLGIPIWGGLSLQGFYAQAWDRNFNAIPEADSPRMGERRPSSYGLALAYTSEWEDGKGEAYLRYAFLPEGSGPGGYLLLQDPALRLFLSGQYVMGSSPWYKLQGEAGLKGERFEASLRFGLAQGFSRYQAALEALGLLHLSKDLRLGLGYGEFAALRAYGYNLVPSPSLDTPYLYAGGSGTGQSQWATLVAGAWGLSLRYDYIFAPRPVDRFGLSYSFQLP